ncbi:uncharacterized protein V6R79_019760 [Siganus canaliculatus]
MMCPCCRLCRSQLFSSSTFEKFPCPLNVTPLHCQRRQRSSSDCSTRCLFNGVGEGSLQLRPLSCIKGAFLKQHQSTEERRLDSVEREGYCP